MGKCKDDSSEGVQRAWTVSTQKVGVGRWEWAGGSKENTIHVMLHGMLRGVQEYTKLCGVGGVEWLGLRF